MPVCCESHLFFELKRLDALLAARVERLRLDPIAAGYNQFRGLFLSDEEIDAILPGRSDTPVAENPEAVALETHAAELRREASAMACDAPKPQPLVELARLFELNDFDLSVLLLCLAPEIDRKYEKLYAYLQNDVMRKWPTLDLALDLNCTSLEERLACRERLLATMPLLLNQLVTFAPETGDGHASLLSRPLRLDDRIAAYLLDADVLDEAIAGFTQMVTPSATMDDLLVPEELRFRLLRLRDADERVCLFAGPRGSGRKLGAEALCSLSGRNLLVAQVPQALAAGAITPRIAAKLVREAALRNALLYLDGAEALLPDDKLPSRQALLDALEKSSGQAILGSTQNWNETLGDLREPISTLPFSLPDHTIRHVLWSRFAPELDPQEASALAAKFQFTGGRIRSAVAQARRFSGDGDMTVDDLYQSCRAQSVSRLTSTARRVVPLYRWEDICLPTEGLSHLREICAHMNYRRHVFGEWRFDNKMSLGKGISALFVGAPGTGKTMAAEVIAQELRLDLYKVDLSCVVSKYIGETEKNLGRVFDEADQSNGILFFDEADALFGRRSEVKDSHDRYANIEIDYLLQRMEEYEGIIILASNFQRNIDEAFRRRLRFLIEFPLPDEKYRARIWRNVFPQETPLSDDIDFAFLAHKFKLAGGSIRNIALSAAFLAAQEDQIVGMHHVIRATRRELRKQGRLCVKSDFDHYFELVEQEEATA
jgi:ATPase family associated with various cellular activities (AAA)